ncbi:TetR family transcriptional regulator [Streptomyces sp. NPDC050504]|uniref:TetR/AcrR family transcriptional regulator n=1 Tax=Streptomyces sp. NPDC050504 TaxID=3365618 RepID=UPI00379B2946
MTETQTPRRSETTRAAILAAARERFAADGYERATIRAIARDAAIDPSMVMRYFGNKEGLFAAACEFDLRLPDLTDVPRQDIGRTLVLHFLDRWEQDDVLVALLRTGVTNPVGAERMQEVLKKQLFVLAARVCPYPTQAPVRTALVASQILGMALSRFVLRFPVAVEMDREQIADWLGPTVQRYLTAERP